MKSRGGCRLEPCMELYFLPWVRRGKSWPSLTSLKCVMIIALTQ